MKHAHLVVDENLLEAALRTSGEKTYSGTVNRALADFVSRSKARRILELRGSGLWEGSLNDLRGDIPRRLRRRVPR